jgi:GTP-binding protein
MHTISIIGRPNVGKSTLFNALTKSRDAIVADLEGVTRDRKYGYATINDRNYIFVDTGGIAKDIDDLHAATQIQTELAIKESSAILFVLDHLDGLTSIDSEIMQEVRKQDKPFLCVINKTDGANQHEAIAEFSSLGFSQGICISAKLKRNFEALFNFLDEQFEIDLNAQSEIDFPSPRLAIIGSPNAGKSTLINRYLGENQLITSDIPGTTRDNIFLSCMRFDENFTLIDTAGIRRKSRNAEMIEKFSIAKSLEAIHRSDSIIYLINAEVGLSDNDKSLIGLIIKKGKALAIGINKWDQLDNSQRSFLKRDMQGGLEFASFAQVEPISALHGSGIDPLLKHAINGYKNSLKTFSTPKLNELLSLFMQEHAPPVSGRHRISLKYVHQASASPLIFMIHGNQTEKLPDTYRRYLNHAFRKALRLKGCVLNLTFRSGDNPFAGKKNKPTPKQIKSRKRSIRK